MESKFERERKQTILLVSILSVCVFILLLLSIVLFNNLNSSFVGSAQFIELTDIQDMPLGRAISTLEEKGISYRIVPAEDSRIANRVVKYEFDGSKNEDGSILVKKDSRVKIFANEMGADKVIYLTFDDGPIINYTADMEIYYTTEELLGVLDDYGIKASFFIVGYQMVKTDRSKYVPEILDRGHILASHTYSHEFDKIYSSVSSFVADVQQFENELKGIIGEERYNAMGKYIRFPGGSSTNGYLSVSKSLEYIAAIREKGYKVFDWTALTGDAEGKSTASEFISYLSKELPKAKDKNLPLIVLMHDKYTTFEALPQILDYLIEEGYFFDTVDNCPEYTFAEK